MNSNIGNVDRVIRLIFGLGLIVFAIMSHGIFRWAGLIGLVLIVTAIVSFCPAYWVMRIRTIGSPSSRLR